MILNFVLLTSRDLYKKHIRTDNAFAPVTAWFVPCKGQKWSLILQTRLQAFSEFPVCHWGVRLQPPLHSIGLFFIILL